MRLSHLPSASVVSEKACLSLNKLDPKHYNALWNSSGFNRIFSSVDQSCPTPCDPMDCNTPGFPVHHQLPEFTQTHVHWVSDATSNHLILCCRLLLLPSIFPSIRVSSNESVLRIRWPKYWSFSFSLSSSNAYSVLISFRTDWLWSPCSPRDSQEYRYVSI